MSNGSNEFESELDRSVERFSNTAPLFPRLSESDELELKQLLDRLSNIDFANESDESESESKQLLERLDNIDFVKRLRELQSLLVESTPQDGVREASILFVNLYGVDRLTQHMEAETRAELLSHYFEVMGMAILENQGRLDKYIGSTMMAVFNSLQAPKDHALMAIKTALAMRDRLSDFNSHWFPEAPHPLTLGIGINTDQVFCGNVGSPQLMEFTAVGHGVNVANYLSQQGQHFGCDILIGQKTYERCADSIQVREKGLTQLKPEGKQFKIYELIGMLEAA